MFLFSWRSWLKRTFSTARRKPRARPRPTYRPRVEDLEVRWVPSINLTTSPISATEGASATVMVATFTDTTPSLATDYTGTVDWGDGTTTAAMISALGGNFTVTGTHTFAEETLAGAPLTATVTINENVGDLDTASGTTTATVADAAVTGTATTISATENSAVTATVATFTDAAPLEPVGNYGASIDWGDSTTTTGVVSTSGDNKLTVAGTHTYAEEGSFAVNVTLMDEGGASGTANSTANVAEDANFTATGLSVAATEGTSASVPVATFTDLGTPDGTGSFSASIDWGDGTTTAGTIVAGNGNFTVNGTHTYADEGNFTITTTITEQGVPSSIQATSTATAQEGDVLTPGGGAVTIAATEGTSFNGSVAIFSDSYTGNTSGDFTASVDWGDGATTAGTVSGGSGAPLTVSGSHTYTDEGNFSVTVTITDVDDSGSGLATATATATNTANVAEADALTGTGTTITTTEGTGFSGTVATFTDTFTGNTAGDFTATIDWGDGTTDVGTVTGSGGTYSVSGTHFYAEDGQYTVTTTLSDVDDDGSGQATATATATSTANVAEDTNFVSNSVTFSTTEGSTFSGTVATFTDTGSLDSASNFSATIDWGDGATTAGTVSGAAGQYTVSGSHVYADEGNFSVTVTLTETTAQPPASVVAVSTAQVAEGDVLTPTGLTVTPTEGTAFTGTVATFTDTFTGNTAGDFSATIDWGDGTTSAGVVTGSGSTFSVVGSHTYADEGNFTITANLVDTDDDGSGQATANATAVGTAQVAEGDVLTGTGLTIPATEGTAVSGTIATFTDTFTGNTAADFTATIDWGDGTTTAGTVTGSGSTFSVNGTHTYADEGNFTVSVALTDINDDGSGQATATATATSTANIAEADALTGTGTTLAATEGTAVSGTVATFTDTFSGNTASDFTATIDWGDGTTTSGTVTGGGGLFAVNGTHTYADEGNFTVTVTLADDAPGTATATATSTVMVADADALTGVPTTIAATEGTAVSGTIATFTDTFTGNTAADFTATIDWGDGTTTVGTVTGSGSTFSVSGTHLYTDEGNFTATVTLTDVDDDGSGQATATATAISTVQVAEADVLTPVGVTVSGTEGAAISGTVATFNDTFTGNTAADFTASIDWGDGTTTSGTVTGSGSTFSVSGSHTYADEGAFTVSVALTDINDDGSGQATATATATSTANIAEADALTGTGTTLAATEGTAVSGTLATFTDTFSGNTASDFTATIDWGDGTTTSGTVSGGASLFAVNGTHTYADEGNFTVTVTLADDAPGTATATATSTVKVADADVLTAGNGSGATTEGALTPLAFQFTDSFAGNTASDFTATIDWGDGTTTAGTVSGSGNFFTVSGSHTYADEGTFNGTVTLTDTDDDGSGQATATASPTFSVTVNEADTLTASAAQPTVAPTEGTAFSGSVATFSDTFAGNTASDFTATIDWGDGTTTAGTVSGGAGKFTVSGSHTYADEGTFTATVTLTDDAPGTATATATNTVTVAEGDALTPVGMTVAATEGTAFSGTVATFTDTFTGNTAADFTASIDWGDGTTTAGTVTGSGSTFSVSGTHTYADEGNFTALVTLADDTPGTATATAASTVQVADADSLSPVSATLAATEGTAVSGTVATFTDTFTGNTAADFSATIDWGDGTVTNGTVSGSGSTFSVHGTHTYADEGNFTVAVTLTDTDDDGSGNATATATAFSTVQVAEADALTGVPTTVAATEGTAVSATIATFNDTFTGNTAADFSATIDWGDGTTTSGTVTGSGGNFSVTGTHTYADEGTFTATVVLTDINDDGSGQATATATATSTVNVAEADVLTPVGMTVSGTEGTAVSGSIAAFTDTFSNNTAADFTASIDWGDGTTTTGTVTALGGVFFVSGTHTYADEGSFTAKVTLTDDAPGTATATATSTVNIAEGDVLTGTGATVGATEGTAFSGTVATFTDTNTGNTASDFTASIDWGDGTTTSGTVSGSGSTFSVSGSHTYADEGNFTALVTLTDDAPGTATATATATVQVADADSLTPFSATLAATEGTAVSGTVATFTDTFIGNTAADFSATIDWGDGTTTSGTVSGSGSTFSVNGTHTYADEGNFTVAVTLTDTDDDGSGNATATATAFSTVQVAEADTLTGVPTTVTATEGTAVSATIATFNDTFTGNTAADFSATIDWGDGTTTSGTVSGSGGTFSVSGTHTYADEGTFTATVVLTDINDDGSGQATATATAVSTVTVAEGDVLTVTAGSFNATEGTSSGPVQVATFSDTFTGNVAGDFTAQILWGDGTTSAGTITGAAGKFTVTGSHFYADEGQFSTTIRISDDSPGTATGQGVGTANVAEADVLTSAGTTLSATEGVGFTAVQVATFSDTGYPSNPDTDFTATIDWGDGTTSAGVIVLSAGLGNFKVLGTHTYLDEGSFTATITIADDQPGTATTVATTAVTVAENDALTGTGVTITPTEGTAFTGTVATFADTNTTNVAGDFTATIDWGDGTTTSGIVIGGSGLFTVNGTHTYADEGSFTITATLTDDAPGTATATATSTATVAEGDVLTPIGTTITGTEGTAVSGTVATFTDTNLGNVAGDFTATIDWGDGVTTSGTVSGSGSTFSVSGTHTYADEGNFTVKTTITDDAPGTATATATSTAKIAEADILTAITGSGTTMEGTNTPLSFQFTDTFTGNNAGDFTATIDWGDGTTTAGVVSGSGALFTVTGTHTYKDEGAFTGKVTLTDDAPGTATATAIVDITVTEGDTLTASVPQPTIAATEGSSVSSVVATFNDTFTGNTAADFTASIDWGDGTTTTGTITGGAGKFTVSGTHSYADEGSFTVQTTLTDIDDDGSGQATATATATTTATVAEADVLNPIGVTIAPTEGTAFNGIVAFFTDSFTGNVKGDFTATVDWGDGTTTAGVVLGSGGSFTVTGSHTYADEGNFTIKVTLTDDAPGTATATATSTAAVAEGDHLTGSGIAITPTEGTAFTGAVATFADTNAGNVAGDFTASIDWGDGTTTTGTVSGGAGTFTVSGTHTYGDEGSFNAKVTLTDDAPGTATATAVSAVTVAEGDTLTGNAATIAAITEGQKVTGTVATFSDTFTGNVAGDFTATIDWADGTTTAGTVTGGAGKFTVSGSHTYTDEGSFAVKVTLTDDAPGTATATATSTVTVNEADALTGTGTIITMTEGSAFIGTVAVFTDTFTGNTAGDFTATVDWGDGTTTAATVSGSNGHFTIAGAHTYAEDGSFMVKATLADDAPGTATATATTTAQIAEAAFTGVGMTIAATEGASFSGTLATFSDPGSTDPATSFTATINWGDGLTSTGTVTGSAGSYTVAGTHAYAEEGSFNISVALTETTAVPQATATASGKANVADAALTAHGTTITPTEGLAFSGVVATFTDADPNGVTSDYTDTIDWGDGTTTSGTIVANGSGGFNVVGTHTYAEEGASTIHVTIKDVGGSMAMATSAAAVQDAALTATANPVNVSGEDVTFSGVVATFMDMNPNGTLSDFSATIDWGDGTTSVGTIGTSGGKFTVSGSHAFAEPSSSSGFTVTIKDVGGSMVTVTGPVTIAKSETSFAQDVLLELFGTTDIRDLDHHDPAKVNRLLINLILNPNHQRAVMAALQDDDFYPYAQLNLSKVILTDLHGHPPTKGQVKKALRYLRHGHNFTQLIRQQFGGRISVVQAQTMLINILFEQLLDRPPNSLEVTELLAYFPHKFGENAVISTIAALT
jgi:PKD repeat protein